MRTVRESGPAFRPGILPAYLLLSLPILVSSPDSHAFDSTGISREQAPNASAARNPEFEKTFGNALLYVPEAQRQGVTVDNAEIEKRVETYRKLYPANHIDKDRVKTILLAEAYLERQGVQAGNAETAVVTEQLKQQGFQDEAELERARRAHLTAALLQKDDIRSGGRKLMNMEKLRRQLERPPLELWTVDELRLPGPPETCLAWLETECYVTVEEFNAAAAQFEFPKTQPLDSARNEVARKYAQAKYSAGSREAGEPEWDENEVLKSYVKSREGSRWLKWAMELGIPERDPRALEAAYRKYYPRYFRAREDATLSLIGSSDSAYIDSLHKVLTGLRVGAASPAGTRFPAAKEPVLPWIAYPEEDLPSVLRAPTDTFRIGDFTTPIRTPYGFFIVRLSRLESVKEKTFADAFGMVSYLATRDNFLELDSLVEVKTRQYYRSNLSEFELPDTLELRAWLAPFPSAQPAGGKAPNPLPPDTLRFRPLRLSSLALPEPLRLELQKTARREPRKTFFGPFPGPYGRWHFQVTRTRRAVGAIPYAIARRAIREKLSVLPRIARDTATSAATQDKVFLNLALSRRRLRFQEERVQEQVAGEIEARLRSGALDTARIADGRERQRELRTARFKLQDELWSESQAQDREFLDRIRIDLGQAY